MCVHRGMCLKTETKQYNTHCIGASLSHFAAFGKNPHWLTLSQHQVILYAADISGPLLSDRLVNRSLRPRWTACDGGSVQLGSTEEAYAGVNTLSLEGWLGLCQRKKKGEEEGAAG